MVGPGTGVAPFVGFLQRRAALMAAPGAPARALWAPAWLFYGCRSASQDFLFRGELEGWLADATLSVLETAFSREEGPEKVYVQQRLSARGAELAELLTREQKPGCAFVCGDGVGIG